MVVGAGVRSLRRRDLLSQFGDLGILGGGKLVSFGQHPLVCLVLPAELHREAHNVLAGQRRGSPSEGRIKLGAGGHNLRPGGVAEGRPHDDVVQLAQHIQGCSRWDRPGLVDGEVAELADQVELVGDAHPNEVLEGRVADPRREIVAVGEGKTGHVVEMLDHALDGPAAIETR